MKCPVCADTDLLMSDRQGIEIDYCPKCRGVWLDRGELDKIIERSAGNPAQSAAVPQGEHRGRPTHRDHEYDKRKKKSSLLGDLFDF